MGTRLYRLIALVATLGVASQLLVGLLVANNGPIARLDSPGHPQGWAQGPILLALLLGLTFAGDLVAVRVRHGDQIEELTLFEAAVVVDVLLLPALPALLVPVVASLLCSLVRRRGLPKTLFNAANLAAATAVLVGSVELFSQPGQGLSGRTVGALAVGALAFTLVNLVALSRVLALVGDETDPWAVVRHGARLSAVMAVGTVALGGTVVIVAHTAPWLLPFTVMPAAALTFAYRAAAQESAERARSSRLLALSQLLAGQLDREVLLASFLDLCRQAFDADVAYALLDTGTTVVADRGAGPSHRSATDDEKRLLRGSRTASVLRHADLPRGSARAILAPLEAEGRRIGVLVLAARDRLRPLGARELTLLTPLGSALAVALRAAEHLQRITEETSKLQAVVDASSDGILVLDADGKVALWSPAMVGLTGRTESEAIGRQLACVMPTRSADGAPCDPAGVGRATLMAQAPEAVVELTVLRSDGEERVVRCAHAGVFEGRRLLRDVVIVHDVTRERQVERMKADFIATVSHELRTPVTPIKGYADLLRRRGDQMTPEKRRECLDVIVDRAAHLARLVEDLLLTSRMAAAGMGGPVAAQVAMDVHDMGSLVRRACGDFGTEDARLRLSLPDGPVPVSCDSGRVIQVLTNLASNALKYSEGSSRVDVRLRVLDGRALVEVEDRGRGIPADQLERVFDKFHRVEDPMRMTTGGTGLGLYIARQLTTAMGGTLTCRSTLGEGACFTLSLAVAKRDHASFTDVMPVNPWDAASPPRPRAAAPSEAAPPPTGPLAGEMGPRRLG